LVGGVRRMSTSFHKFLNKYTIFYSKGYYNFD